MVNSMDGLSTEEREDFHVICQIAELQWSEFEIHLDCEPADRLRRTGRRLVNVLYKPSGQCRTYRAGVGNNWMSAVEEDINLHCFVSWPRKTVQTGTEGIV